MSRFMDSEAGAVTQWYRLEIVRGGSSRCWNSTRATDTALTFSCTLQQGRNTFYFDWIGFISICAPWTARAINSVQLVANKYGGWINAFFLIIIIYSRFAVDWIDWLSSIIESHQNIYRGIGLNKTLNLCLKEHYSTCRLRWECHPSVQINRSLRAEWTD